MNCVKKYIYRENTFPAEKVRKGTRNAEPDTGAAWSSGYAAAWDAYPFDSNPYRETPYNDPDAAEVWEQGFREAEREIDEMDREPEIEALDLLLPQPGETRRQQPPGPNGENRWLFWGNEL